MAEHTIGARCEWAGARRVSAGNKPTAMKVLGRAVTVVAMALLVFTSVFIFIGRPAQQSSERMKLYCQQAAESMARGAILEPQDDSVHYWLQKVEAETELHPCVKNLKAHIRDRYTAKAIAVADDDARLSRAYLETAAIAAPGPEVADAHARLQSKR